MAEQNAREKLLDFLDKKAFEPVLNADPKDYPESQRSKLKDVQSTTRSTQKRYHESYQSAQEVVDNFRDDLSSDSAHKVQAQLRDLDLPTLDSVEGAFKKLADDLNVGH